MTSRQRMLAAIHHERPDRVPVSPWGLGRIPPDGALAAELIARTDPWLEVGLGCDPVGGAALEVTEQRMGDPVRKRVAPIGAGYDPRGGAGCNALSRPATGGEEQSVGRLLRRVIHTPGRDLVSVWTTTEHTTACTEPFCKSIADIEILLSIPYVRPHPDASAYFSRRQRIGEEGLVVLSVEDGLCYPFDMLGAEYCCYLWAAQPDVVRRMVERAALRTLDVVEEACRSGVDCFRVVGGEYATQLMGPRGWSELVAPFDGPLVEMIHSYGGIVHYHNHGNVRRFLQDLMRLGIDSLDPIEQPPYGDTPMEEAAALIGRQVCLVGGLDDMEVLETRPREEVLERGAELLDRVSSAGYMLGGTSSGIYGEQAARNFIALVEIAERASRRTPRPAR